MSTIRQRLVELSEECEALCRRNQFVGPQTGQPNFRLIYTSVDTYEQGNDFVIIGLNPGGSQADADADERDRPFQEIGYSAYLDDNFQNKGVGGSDFQRSIQGIAMIMTGSSPSQAISAMKSPTPSVEDRIGANATTFLRSTPSLNIIPFRHSYLKKVPLQLRRRGAEIGWELLCLMMPKPKYIITLTNDVNAEIWKTIRDNSEGSLKMTCQERVFKGYIGSRPKTRNYREGRVMKGPLKAATLIGLPAVVHDKQDAWDKVTAPLFEVLSQRLNSLGIA